MDLSSIVSAILAGGLAGQIVTLFWGNSLTQDREFGKWLTEEKFKIYSDFLSLLSHAPRDEDSLKSWHLDIREMSLRIYLLFPDGNPPEDLKMLMEEAFQLAKRKKNGESSDELSAQMRSVVKSIRQSLSKDLHSSGKK